MISRPGPPEPSERLPHDRLHAHRLQGDTGEAHIFGHFGDREAWRKGEDVDSIRLQLGGERLCEDQVIRLGRRVGRHEGAPLIRRDGGENDDPAGLPLKSMGAHLDRRLARRGYAPGSGGLCLGRCFSALLTVLDGSIKLCSADKGYCSNIAVNTAPSARSQVNW